MVQRRKYEALAWANDTSRRAIGWAGEKVRAVEAQSGPIPGEVRGKVGKNILRVVST